MDLQRQNNSGCLFPFGDGLLPNLVFFLQLNEHSLEGKQIEDDEDEEEKGYFGDSDTDNEEYDSW
ncbi:MAG TPA: hypothetical protein PK738_06545 [Bacteroidales bacterium]|jgi:hypothetical protein|nr:hypothetical protein [Bacteroidales bacterium]